MDIKYITDLAVAYGTKIIMALIALILGLIVIRMLTRLIGKALSSRNVDTTLRPFIKGLISTGLKAALFISVLGIVGVKTTSFIAILGAAGLAVGMALQGSLGNFAGGVLILIFRPFKSGDVVETQGYTGTINEIGIFCTTMKTPDNKTIILPNGPLAGGAMVNFSTEETRRVDWTFGIGYNDDLKKAQKIILTILDKDSRTIKDKDNFARVSELAESSVNFSVRAWVNASDYWDLYFDVIENVKITFDKQGISFPYPQQDIHLIEKTTSPLS